VYRKMSRAAATAWSVMGGNSKRAGGSGRKDQPAKRKGTRKRVPKGRGGGAPVEENEASQNGKGTPSLGEKSILSPGGGERGQLGAGLPQDYPERRPHSIWKDCRKKTKKGREEKEELPWGGNVPEKGLWGTFEPVHGGKGREN